MPKLIIFDKDGTLMELGSIFVKLADDVINEFSSRTNIHVPKSEIKDAFNMIDEKIDMFAASSSARKIVEKLSRLPDGISISQFVSKKLESMHTENEASKIEIIEGVKETLAQLKSEGYQLAIVSADDTESMDLFLNKFNIKEVFDKIVTSDNSKYHKPQKELLEEVMQALNCTPEETIMVGDTEMDVMLGRNAGVHKVIGVLSGSGDSQDLQNADVILNSVAELYDVI